MNAFKTNPSLFWNHLKSLTVKEIIKTFLILWFWIIVILHTNTAWIFILVYSLYLCIFFALKYSTVLAYRCDGVFNIAYSAYFLFLIQFSQILMYMYYTSIHNILEYFMNFPWWKKFSCFLAWIAINLHNLLFTIICRLLHTFFSPFLLYAFLF